MQNIFLNKFQFYLSSIKSRRCGCNGFTASVFQFYLSSIKSECIDGVETLIA